MTANSTHSAICAQNVHTLKVESVFLPGIPRFVDYTVLMLTYPWGLHHVNGDQRIGGLQLRNGNGTEAKHQARVEGARVRDERRYDLAQRFAALLFLGALRIDAVLQQRVRHGRLAVDDSRIRHGADQQFRLHTVLVVEAIQIRVMQYGPAPPANVHCWKGARGYYG